MTRPRKDPSARCGYQNSAHACIPLITPGELSYPNGPDNPRSTRAGMADLLTRQGIYFGEPGVWNIQDMECFICGTLRFVSMPDERYSYLQCVKSEHDYYYDELASMDESEKSAFIPEVIGGNEERVSVRKDRANRLRTTRLRRAARNPGWT